MSDRLHIIFDLDGTLIDSSDGIVESANYAFEQAGEKHQPKEAIVPFIGFPLEQMFAHFSDYPVSDLVKLFRSVSTEKVVAATLPLPGVEDILDELNESGNPMAIATTKGRANVDGILTKLGWQHFFKARVSCDDVRQVKPHPEAFQAALQLLNATPDNAIVVGDTINDILAAQAVPLPIVAISSPYGHQAEVKAAKPDYFIKSLSELLPIIEHELTPLAAD